MQEEKLITVITTLYNKAPYLETWAISVAAQTYLDKVRVIVIDDGSTDGSLELIKEYAAKYQIPVEIFVHAENRGLLRTILEAYHLLETKYFAVLDADDYWLTEKKLEKAIDFLEAHEDYSGYASNYLCLSKTNATRAGFPPNFPNSVFTKVEEIPEHIQTPSAVFRNFFTPELLNEMENVSAGRRVHICETDPFRNYLALAFGKIYFENSLDAVWRFDIGEWGSMDNLCKIAFSIQEYFELFDFYAKNFGIDDNAFFALKQSFILYNEVINQFMTLLKEIRLSDFKAGKYFRDRFFDYGESDVEKLSKLLLKQHDDFEKVGIRLNGNKVSVNLSPEYVKAAKWHE